MTTGSEATSGSEAQRAEAQFTGEVGLAAYQSEISQFVYPIRIDIAGSHQPFRAAIAARAVGSISLIHASCNTSFHCTRRPAPRRSANDAFLLQFQRSGATINEQRGARAWCPAGTMVLLDARSTVTAEQVGAAEALVVSIPAPMLLAHFPQAADACATAIDAADGAPRILADMVARMWQVEAAFSMRDRQAVPAAMIRLIETVFAEEAEARARQPGTALRFGALERTIAEHCYDPELDAERLAGLIGVSRRTLFSLSQRHHTSVERMIIEARLGAVERRLGDPACLGQSLTDLAFQAGFRDFSHFCRRFKARFGATPGAYRRAALGARPTSLHAQP